MATLLPHPSGPSEILGRERFLRKLRIIRRDGAMCYICRRALDGASATIEHLVPRCRGGDDDWTNLAVACVACNQAKGALTPLEFAWRRTGLGTRRGFPMAVGPITTKAEYRRRARMGLLGNQPATYKDPFEARADGISWDEPMAVRFGTANSPHMKFDVPLREVAAYARSVGDPHGYYLHPMYRGGRTFSATLVDGPGYAELRYALSPEPLPVALDGPAARSTDSRSVIREVLRYALSDADYDDLQDLQARYPGHVFELSSFDRPVGTLAPHGRRMLVWEVRFY